MCTLRCFNTCVHRCSLSWVELSCQTGLTTGLTTVLNEQQCLFNRLLNHVVQPVWQTRFENRVERTDCSFNTIVQPGLTTGCITRYTCLSNRMFVYTIQAFWQPVWQRVWQPVVSCKQGFSNSRLSVTRHIRPKSLPHQDMSALVVKCLYTSDLRLNTAETAGH